MNKLASMQNLRDRFCWLTGILHRSVEEHEVTCLKEDRDWHRCAYGVYPPGVQENWDCLADRREWEQRRRRIHFGEGTITGVMNIRFANTNTTGTQTNTWTWTNTTA